MKVERVTWQDFSGSIKKFLQSIPRYDNYVGILNGGALPAMLLAKYNQSNLVYIKASHYDGKKRKKKVALSYPSREVLDMKGTVLLVDDVSDTGDTLRLAKETFFISDELTLHQKPWTKLKPKYCWRTTDKWLIYPWEEYEKTKRRR